MNNNQDLQNQAYFLAVLLVVLHKKQPVFSNFKNPKNNFWRFYQNRHSNFVHLSTKSMIYFTQNTHILFSEDKPAQKAKKAQPVFVQFNLMRTEEMMKEKTKGSRLPAILGILMIAAAGTWVMTHNLSGSSAGIPGGTNQQRIEYIESFGWSAGSTPSDVKEIRIPVKFDDAYEVYNQLQQEQGFDLRKYKAHSVKQYTYEIMQTDDDPIPLYANLLVENDIIIGADVTSAEAGSLSAALSSNQ